MHQSLSLKMQWDKFDFKLKYSLSQDKLMKTQQNNPQCAQNCFPLILKYKLRLNIEWSHLNL